MNQWHLQGQGQSLGQGHAQGHGRGQGQSLCVWFYVPRQRIFYSARGAVYRINSLIYIQVFDDENSIKQAVQVNTKDLKRAYIGEARSVKASVKAGEPLRSQKRKTREKLFGNYRNIVGKCN